MLAPSVHSKSFSLTITKPFKAFSHKRVKNLQNSLIGKFKTYKEHIQQIEINQVEIGYALDSKGFYQPIYEFSGLIDGESATILIRGIE